ncbi:MAG: hypothetical protein A2172_03950 [Candidatus Woykebacteria bacterium RBG_13_40_15]|uniref:DUF5615 domain-containing protein n=1 Tax=Candidatus Woykebacteria bacterium RBG_13_40_15 TaxID=1802593 RepID=A0A1G1W501_9BACT|nr:MAG: hypothetical protein A2172_03950 [Candidatus Woykebacteria bacterium RBG_13_40_15]
MSLSTQRSKFLLDENVRVELANFLKSKNFDIKLAPKSVSDSTLALISKKEKRIFVTNDEDFVDCDRDTIFSLVWLRVPQNDAELLIKSFNKLLEEFSDFSGNFVVLEPNTWESSPLAE